MKKAAFPGILLAFILMASCKAVPLYELECDPEIPPALAGEVDSCLNKLLQESPGLALKRPLKIRVGLTSPEAENAAELFPLLCGGERISPAAGGTLVILEKKTYAPVAFYYDPRMDISAAELSAGKYPLKPLDEIRLPEKALSLDGLFPGDSGYPLVLISAAVLLQSGDPGKTKSGQAGEKLIEESVSRLKALYREEEDYPITWISFTGDIMPGRGVLEILGGERGLQKVFAGTLPLLQSSDLSIGNLEGAVSGSSSKTNKSYNFKFPPGILRHLEDAGFDYLSITNNHSFDFGLEGFTDTVSNFRKAGMPTSGAGMNRAEALKPWQTRINNTTITIFSLADFPPETKFSGKETIAAADRAGIIWPGDDFFESLETYTEPGSLNIVCVHGGYEWRNVPAERQTALYRKLVDHGAHIVAGTHPHVLQPLESYGESLIAYSLGNFIFPGMDEMAYAEETIILQAGFIRNQLKYINIHPARINGKSVGPDTGGTITERFLELNREWERVCAAGE